MKRPLFVFAGQSNMMGAPVYPASEQIVYKDSYEYLHKPRRFGAEKGDFRGTGFPAGEFSYIDLKAAYGENATANMKSELGNYEANSYFCPAMNDIKNAETGERHASFFYFTEANLPMSPSPAPYIVKGLEEAGKVCAYAHIAKGGTPIKHYLEGGASEYFYEKVRDFFCDAESRFQGDDMSERVLFWHQGESDRERGFDYYLSALETFWERAKKAGFTKFGMIRVGYWGGDDITEIMRAQEEFCKREKDAFMVTRAASFIEAAVRQSEGWFDPMPEEEFRMCRDSFYGFDNQHINEKGFKTIAKYAVPNIIRVIYENEEPLLEPERIIALK